MARRRGDAAAEASRGSSDRSPGAEAASPAGAGSLALAYRDLAELIPAAFNPKAHDLAGIRASMVRFGFGDPVCEDARTGRILEGHGRREALLAMRADGENPPKGISLIDGVWLVPVVMGFATKDDGEAEAYLLTHNRMTERGGWDDRGLLTSLQRLSAAAVPLEGTGFDPGDLKRLSALFAPAAALTRADGDRGAAPREAAPAYREAAFRQIVLVLNQTRFDEAMSLLERVKAFKGFDDNTTAVEWLLHDFAGRHPDPAGARA